MSAQSPPPSARLVLALIMGALVLWGTYLAIGAYLYNLNPWRPVIVLGCVSLFLGFWLWLLRVRGRAARPYLDPEALQVVNPCAGPGFERASLRVCPHCS